MRSQHQLYLARALWLFVVSLSACSSPELITPASTLPAVSKPSPTSPVTAATQTPSLLRLVATPTATPAPALRASSTSTVTEMPFPPAGCSVQEITALIDDFIDGLNKDDPALIGRTFALDGFEEFYAGGTKGGNPYTEIRTSDKAEFLAYVALRHSKHEVRREIEPVRVFPDANRTNSVAFAFLLSREADDLRLTQAGGKGAVYCGGPRIVRWIWDGNQLP